MGEPLKLVPTAKAEVDGDIIERLKVALGMAESGRTRRLCASLPCISTAAPPPHSASASTGSKWSVHCNGICGAWSVEYDEED